MAGEPDSKKLKEYKKLYKELAADELNRLETAEKVNASMDSYFNNLQNSAEAQKIIKVQAAEIAAIEEKIKDLKKSGTEEDEEAIKWMEKQVKNRKKKLELSEKNLAIQKQEASLLKASLNTLKAKVKETYKEHFNFKAIFQYLQDSDKAMKETQIKMGLTGKRAGQLRDNMKGAAANAAVLGVSMGELGRATANFSKELGRARIPSEALLSDWSEISKGTGMSMEAVGTLGAKMKKAGIPTGLMKSTIADVVNSSAQMGLNVEAMTESLSQNIGLMNKLHFKNGIEGLKKLLQTAERFRLNVSEIASLSEKVFRPEGAIELAANLQMMGGEFSRMGDPMTLMFQARNAPEELAKNIAKATAESAIFNAETGKFQFSALEMDRLRQVAEMTGQSMESLTESARAVAQESQIAGKLAFDVDDKQIALLSSAAEFKDGEFKIQIPGGDMVAMKDLTRAQLEDMSQNAETLKERALQAQTFNEAFKAFMDTVKTTFLPLIEVLNLLIWPIQQFSKAIAGLPDWGKGLVMGITIALGLGLKNWLMGLNLTFMKWFGGGKAKDIASKVPIAKSTGLPDKRFGPRGGGKGGQGGFMDKLLKIKPKQLMAFGAAFILIGTGVAIAAVGLAQFVKAFGDLTPEQTAAVNQALLGFGIALGVVMIGLLAFSALAPILGIGVGVLLAFGGAVALIGLGVGLAAAGLSLLVTSFAGLDPAHVAGVAASLVMLGYAFGALVVTLPAMGLVIASLVGISLASHLINTDGVTALATSLKVINDISGEKLAMVTALFAAAASAKPLFIFHMPLEVSGTVTLDAGDIKTDLDMSSVAKKVTDTVQSQLYLTKQGTTPGP